MYIYIHVSIYLYKFERMHSICTHAQYICTCTVYIHTQAKAHDFAAVAYIYICTYINTYICTYTHIHIYIDVSIHMYLYSQCMSIHTWAKTQDFFAVGAGGVKVSEHFINTNPSPALAFHLQPPVVLGAVRCSAFQCVASYLSCSHLCIGCAF